jgi:solute carrier family 30 (zinc transporter), member 1
MLVVVIGAIGLTLNIISILFLHGTSIRYQELLFTLAEHDHDHDHGHGHGHEQPGQVPLQVPTQAEIEPQIAMNSIDVNSDAQSAEQHYEHRHKVAKAEHHHDYGIAGVMIHIAGDAFNNIGVIIAGLVIWKSTSPNRYYADPTVSMAIAIVILLSAVPLGKV